MMRSGSPPQGNTVSLVLCAVIGLIFGTSALVQPSQAFWDVLDWYGFTKAWGWLMSVTSLALLLAMRLRNKSMLWMMTVVQGLLWLFHTFASVLVGTAPLRPILAIPPTMAVFLLYTVYLSERSSGDDEQ